MSLHAWDAIGMLEREVALYRRLQQRGVQVSFVTYGDKRELQYAERMAGISILCNRWNLPPQRYEKLFPLLHAVPLVRAQVFKSNQINGAEIALRAARFWRKKCVARGGFLYAVHTKKQFGEDSPEGQKAVNLERSIYSQADHIVVSAPFMREYIQTNYAVLGERITVIPNYVDTGLFQPAVADEEAKNRLCFIGRLEKQKNVVALLEAVKGLDVDLDIIGSGSLEEDLRQKAAQEGIAAHFLGNLPHTALSQHIHRAALYVQPSLYEGNPKTILEAMACAKAVIGGDSPGIRELISHRRNGFLCATTPDAIRAAVVEVLADSDLRQRMGEAARQYVVENFSLDRVVEMELKLYRELMSNSEE